VSIGKKILESVKLDEKMATPEGNNNWCAMYSERV